jgi:hypothetical protein
VLESVANIAVRRQNIPVSLSLPHAHSLT